VLYRLPKLLSLPGDKRIYYVEGERDVHTLEWLGLFATTHAGGASSFREELLEPIRDRPLTVIPDRDDPGMQMGRRVWAAARKYGMDISFILLPRGKDVTEFIEQNGSAEELERHRK
jgi:DNA primase